MQPSSVLNSQLTAEKTGHLHRIEENKNNHFEPRSLKIYLRTVPDKYKGFCAKLGPRGKSWYLQGLLESTKIGVAMHFFEIISLESQQKC